MMVTLTLVLALPSLLASPTPAWSAESPHLSVSGGTTCRLCHVPHQATSAAGLFREYGESSGEIPVCYQCHDGLGSNTDIMTGSDSFGLVSGHVVEGLTEADPSADLTNVCSSCHKPHGDYSARPKLPAVSVNGIAIGSAGNAWCLACHDDGQSWYAKKGAYPSLLTPSRDASGYPVTGTFAGASVYADPLKNAHAGIPSASGAQTRQSGDCLYCHAAHGSAARYDALVATLAPSTGESVGADRSQGAYAALCFTCHGGGSWEASGAANIKRYVTHEAGDTGIGASGGHRIKSPGGTLPVNAPLPCYDCHNPHGSSRGNARLLSDALGAGLDTTVTAGPEAVRRFCLTCHTTSDGLGWDSAAYVAPAADAKVEGLKRLGGDPGSGPDGGLNWLRLRPASGHLSTDTSMNCYDCHGGVYASSSSNNVHDPATYTAASHTGDPAAAVIRIIGVDYGPFTCSECHLLELGPEHAKPSSVNAAQACSECHPYPRSTLSPWNKATCAQGGCHTMISTQPTHALADTAHTAPSVSCTGGDCHGGAGSLAALHSEAATTVAGVERTSCEVCHSAGVPTSGACSSCHDMGLPHGDDASTHAASPGSGDIAMSVYPWDNEHGENWVAPNLPCVQCHTPDLLAQHGSDCSLCHAGADPAGGLGVWGKACQQGACHPAIHTSQTWNHHGASWNSSSSCELCHTYTSEWPGPWDCYGCH
jgi:predicted CXXCH cytochrome family protein